MNSFSCPTGSNCKSEWLKEVYICRRTVLDTRREQINWLDDITWTSYKATGEDRPEGKLESGLDDITCTQYKNLIKWIMERMDYKGKYQ